MKLNNKDAKRKFGLTETVTSTGFNASYYKKDSGDAYVFDIDGYKVVKNVYYSGKVDYVVSGKNITEATRTDVLDMLEIENTNEKLRLDILSNIMNTDLTRVKDIMTKNKKGFIYFMEHLISEGLTKDLAFASVIKDFYADEFNYHEDTNAIIKIMVKYGYEFTSIKEANKLIR
jgi:hypothetical protein